MSHPSVIHISHNYHVEGGSDRYFMELSRLLERHGHEVIPFCAQSEKNIQSEHSKYFPKAFNADNLSIKDIARYIYSFEAKKKINYLLQDHFAEIAHLHIYYGKLTSSILGSLKSRGIPIVQTLHEYKLLCPVYTCISNRKVCESCGGSQYWRCTTKRCNRGSIARSLASTIESYTSKFLGSSSGIDHFIAVSNFMAEKMQQIGIPKEKISTVHNFVDCTRYAPAENIGQYILYFGRLDRVKGIYTLLKAMKKLPNVKCIIAGTGPEEEAIRRAIKEAPAANIEFAGFLNGEALTDAIRNSICTILPSEWYENCPMSILESMALGRPVIGSRMGGIPELLIDGEDGVLFEAGNVDDLANAISQITSSPNKAFKMGLAGRHKVEQKFSSEGHYRKIRKIYSHLLGA